MTDGCVYQHNFSLHIFSVESEMLASVRQVLQNTKMDGGMSLSSMVENRTLACGKDLKNEGGELCMKRGGIM